VYTTLLFLHVLSAFALAAGIGLYWLMFATGDGPLLGLTRVAQILWTAGSIFVLVFGIWLALHVPGYGILDGWILAAIVLWFVLGAFGGRVGKGFSELRSGKGGRPDVAALAIMTVTMVLLLIDMIWKPGA